MASLPHLRGLLVTAVVVLALSGCGGPGGSGGSAETAASQVETLPLPAELRVTLDGYMGAENVGILMADKRGYFDDVGLSVWVGSPAIPKNSIYYVGSGIDLLGVVPLPEAAKAQENGLTVVAVGSLVSRPTAALIWLRRSEIRRIADLKGKTIGVPGLSYQKDLLRVVLERAGLTLEDVSVEQIAYRLVPALQRGQVDAIFGGSANIEGVALKSRGADPVIKPVQGRGVPDYDELAVVTRSSRVAADPQAFRDFMSAVRRGTMAAVKHPAQAAEVIEKSSKREPGSTPGEIRAQLKATLPLLSRTGRLNLDRTRELLDWMHERGMLRQAMPASELLAGSGSG